MRIKRILSVFLTACILLSLFPAFVLPARAASRPNPEYLREPLPEQVIFNAINGKNEDYFKSVMKSTAYNAVAAKRFKDDPGKSTALTYSTEYTSSGWAFYEWSEFRNTQLAKLSDACDELEVGMAVTVTNDYHYHTYSIYKCWLTSYTDAYLCTYGASAPLYSAYGYSKSQSSIRRGNAKFHDLPENMYVDHRGGTPLRVEFYGSVLGYYNDKGTCKCAGSATGTVVSFYDGVAPMIESVLVKRKLPDGTTEETTNFKKGDDILIELVCSEPLRFADDSASGKGDICIGLMVDRSTDRLPAYLTKLEGNTLTFTYHVDENETSLYTITGLDLTAVPDGGKALCTTKTEDTGIPLKQVFHGRAKLTDLADADRSYKVEVPATAVSAVGYTESTSYVTDMAGNALTLTKKDWAPKRDGEGNFVLKPNGCVEEVEVEVSAIPRISFYIDCQAPFVAKAVFNADTYNDDVKGLPDMPALDPSDTYLGVGDKISVTLYMNEVVEWSNYNAGTAETEPKITTNMRIQQGASPDPSDPPFTLTLGEYSHWTPAKDVGDGYGLGSSDGWVSVIYSHGYWLRDYYWVDDPEGIIRITGISFGSDGVTDASGNVAYTGSVGSVSGQYRLDVTPPAVTSVTNDSDILAIDAFAAVQTRGVNTEFYVPFLVSDAGSDETQSGVTNLPGTLILSEPGGGTGRFEYVISSFTEPEPGKEWTWSTGYMGAPISFTQTGTTQYLHVRPIQGESYNFSNFDQNRAAIQFTLRDFAGNKIATEAKELIFKPGVGVDGLPPQIALEQVNKTYDNNISSGVLTIKLEVTDPSKVTSVQYQWVEYTIDSDTEPVGPWQSAVFAYVNSEETVADVTISEIVPNNEVFRKILWVKATDGSGSAEEGVGISTVKLGDFSYDLASGIKYSLEYTTGIQTEFNMLVNSIESGGNLLFDVSADNSDTHYIYVLSSGSALASLFGSKTGYGHDSWEKATLSTENGRTYTISAANDFWYQSYTGNLYITVYSGDDSTISINGASVQVNGNAKEETIRLRRLPASTKRADRDAAFTGTMPFYTDNYESLTFAPAKEYGSDTGKTSISTLEGVPVYIDLGTDAYGWNFEDIDWDNSYIAYDWISDHNYYAVDDFNEAIYFVKNNATKLCPIGRGPRQTIILPASNLYRTGVNQDLYLILARYSSPDTPYFFPLNRAGTTKRIAIDKTEPGRVELRVMGSQAVYDQQLFIGNMPKFQRISYDPSKTVYIPWEGQRVDLSVAALTADGAPAHYTEFKPTPYNDYYMGTYHIEAKNLTEDTGWRRLSHEWWDGTESEFPRNHSYSINYDEYENRTITFTDLANAYAENCLGLVPDTDNRIAFRIVYGNGKFSELTYLTVHPVTIKLTGAITASPEAAGAGGLVTVDPGTASVRFTPDAGANTAGLTLYCEPGFAYSEFDGSVRYYFDFVDTLAGLNPELFRMEQEGDAYVWHVYDASEQTELDYGIDSGILHFMEDGTYFNCLDVYDAVEDMHYAEPAGFYIVYAIDQYRNRHVLGITDNGIIADGRAPQIAEILDRDNNTYEAKGVITQAGEGVYTASYKIWDDSLYAYDNGALSRPMTMTLSYDEAYADIAGTGNLTLTDVGDGYSWTVEESSRTGILQVTANLIRSATPEFRNDWYDILPTYANSATEVYLQVDVTFVVSPKLTAPADVTLYLTATDAHGNTAEPAGVTASVTGVAPEVVSAQYKATGAGTDMALYLTFNVPVQPEESWIKRDISGFDTQWHDAFPIWKDGEWDISFTDVFGAQYAKTLTLTDVFGDYGIDLGFSTLDYVAADEGVTITAAADGDGETVTGSATVTQNGTYTVTRAAGGETDTLTIHLNNIVSGGPECTLYFYFEEFSEMFKAGADNQPRGETTAPVVVSYRTDREVSPVGATTLTFRSGDDDSFSFSYYDVATDHTYTVSGKLSDPRYDITIGAPPEPYTDEDAPSIKIVTLWKQKGGGFVQAEAFPGNAAEDEVKSAIERSGAAQSYDFVVNAADYSRWKVLVTAAAPTDITHASEGDTISGVSIQGNNVLVTNKAADFWIVVVDYASEDTAATADNFTAIKIPAGSYQFDTTPPEIDLLPVADGLYSKTVYVRATDLDDQGLNTSPITITGAGIVEETAIIDGLTYTHKLIFTDNDTEILVTATDGAGNSASKTVQVSGIDVNAPTLFVTWTPCFQDVTTGELDHNNPTAGPVNVNVVAHITSDKDILSVTANDGSELVFDENKVAQAAWGSVTYTGERITVRFTEKEASAVRLIVTAPNGKSITRTIALGAGVIDKDPPVVTDTVTPMIREGYAAAYAEKHSLTFDEDVFCISSATPRTLYNAANPYELTLAEGESAVLDFVDRAGNLLTYTVSPQGEIDSTAPEVTAQLDEGLSVTNSPVAVALTANEPCTLTADDDSVTCGVMTLGPNGDSDPIWTGSVSAARNGTFRVFAADAAGNRTEVFFTVYNIDRTIPHIRFENSVISVRQESDMAELEALLAEGFTVWDNVGCRPETLTWYTEEVDLFGTVYHGVDLNTSGIYEIPYTVEDEAGNVGLAIRWLKVVDKNELVLSVDGVLTEKNGTAAFRTGEHTIAVGGLSFEGEPYTLILAKKTLTAGQLKKALDIVTIGEDGKITIDEPGFYTLYVITQSRRSFRTLLYVED